MSGKSKSRSGGIGAFSLLGVVFVTLKLLHISDVAAWSWWWVTAPFWGGLALVLAIFAIASFVAIILALIVAIFNR